MSIKIKAILLFLAYILTISPFYGVASSSVTYEEEDAPTLRGKLRLADKTIESLYKGRNEERARREEAEKRANEKQAALEEAIKARDEERARREEAEKLAAERQAEFDKTIRNLELIKKERAKERAIITQPAIKTEAEFVLFKDFVLKQHHYPPPTPLSGYGRTVYDLTVSVGVATGKELMFFTPQEVWRWTSFNISLNKEYAYSVYQRISRKLRFKTSNSSGTVIEYTFFTTPETIKEDYCVDLAFNNTPCFHFGMGNVTFAHVEPAWFTFVGWTSETTEQHALSLYFRSTNYKPFLTKWIPLVGNILQHLPNRDSGFPLTESILTLIATYAAPETS